MLKILAMRSSAAVMPFAAMTALTLLSGCVGTMGAGCESYAESRLTMPPPETVPAGPWGEWIATTDTRMTGTCT